MRKNKMQRRIIILLILLLSIGLGYAFLTQDLTINGITKVKGNTWDIHFENLQESQNGITLSDEDVAAVIDSSTRTRIDCTVTFNEPGDYYEFMVDAVNDGTINGMVENIHILLNDEPVTTLPYYVDYSITYLDGSAVIPNQILEVGETETFIFKIGYKRDIDEMPTTMQEASIGFQINYIQADEHVKKRLATFYKTSLSGLKYTLDPSWEYYISGKGRIVQAEEDLYELHEYRGDTLNYVDTNGDYYYKLSECQNLEYENEYNGVMNRGICVKVISEGEDYTLDNVGKQVCAVVNGNTFCITPVDWDCYGYNSETGRCGEGSKVYQIKTEAEENGYTCELTSYSMRCTLGDTYFYTDEDWGDCMSVGIENQSSCTVYFDGWYYCN